MFKLFNGLENSFLKLNLFDLEFDSIKEAYNFLNTQILETSRLNYCVVRI